MYIHENMTELLQVYLIKNTLQSKCGTDATATLLVMTDNRHIKNKV